jgi:hypothetical protein
LKLIFLEPILNEPKSNPCVPSPCGPYSICRLIGDTAACSCQSNYIGKPPNCRPECVRNEECSLNLACSNEKCIDPCPGSCGVNSLCNVVRHSSVCSCSPGYTGDPFVACSQIPISKLLLFSLYKFYISFFA